MTRIDEIRDWLNQSGGNAEDVAGYIYRLEVENEAMRRRNGDLLDALRAADPDAADDAIPLADWPTRYVVVDRVVALAAEYARYGGDEVLADLRSAVDLNDTYWSASLIERSERAARTEKARAMRHARKAS